MTFFRRRVFPALTGVLWIWFLCLDLGRLGDSTWVKFAAICLCCLTALLGAGILDGKLVAAALSLTVGADWFLLVRSSHYTLGVCLFIAVQLLYAVRLYHLRGRRPCLWGSVVRTVLLILCTVLAVAEPTLLSLWAVLLYFSNLCVNTVEAFVLKKHAFAVGLLLFVCCDLCVGLWNISLFLPHAVEEFARVGMWLFYLPSQVLIVLSQEQEMRSSDEKAV